MPVTSKNWKQRNSTVYEQRYYETFRLSRLNPPSTISSYDNQTQALTHPMSRSMQEDSMDESDYFQCIKESIYFSPTIFPVFLYGIVPIPINFSFCAVMIGRENDAPSSQTHLTRSKIATVDGVLWLNARQEK